MSETEITDDLTTIGTVRKGDDAWHAYDFAERSICSAPTKQSRH